MKGRVEKGSVAGSTSTGKKSLKSLAAGFAVVKRVDRLNRAKQLAEQKRVQAQVEKRLAGGFGPPKQVVVFGLSQHAKAESIVALLLAQADSAGTSASSQVSGPKERTARANSRAPQMLTVFHHHSCRLSAAPSLRYTMAYANAS